MGMDLVSSSGEDFDISAGWWWFYRTLAQHYGWNPKGTLRPDHIAATTQWNGCYDTSDGQKVNSDDACELANALAKAMSDPRLSDTINNLFENEDDIFKEDFDYEYTTELVEFFKHGEFQIE